MLGGKGGYRFGGSIICDRTGFLGGVGGLIEVGGCSCDCS